MGAERFFRTTRGRIVAELRRRGMASAIELAQNFGLSTNAVRQHLTSLENDGLVAERAMRRGPTKPTLAYSLTAAAESLFPQRYDRMLNAVLREVREHFGDAGVRTIFEGIAQRSYERHSERLSGDSADVRIDELAAILREHGVEAQVERTDEGTIVLHEHNCPYANTVTEHPEVCSIVHTLLDASVRGEYRRTASLATGDTSCRFEMLGRSVTPDVSRPHS